jgi:hypothetical protein
MSSRLRLSIGSVTAVALAYQAVSGSSPATAQTANQPTGQAKTSPNLPSINVEAPAPKRRKPARPASVPAESPAQGPTPAASPAQLQPTQAAPGVGMSNLSTAAAALPAGTTTLDARAIAQTPIASYGDIFRSLPGFEVSNYGQGAIGYGLSMRGYTNAEHGRDIAYYIDGVPVNDISSIHTPNYADLNVLMRSSVSRSDSGCRSSSTQWHYILYVRMRGQLN